MKKKHIGQTIGDNTNEFKVSIYQHISICKTGFNRQVPVSCIQLWCLKRCLQKPCFSLNIMFQLNKSVYETKQLKTIEKHFHLKGYDIMYNPGRYYQSI